VGDLSKNFSRSEFACGDCGRADVVDEHLVEVLQRLRDELGRPLRIISGYRCARYNRVVGGIRFSQHLFGCAADIPRGLVTRDMAKRAGVHGAGVREGWVIHVDVQPGRRFYTFAE
jgi:uncharacterized protein YcbK (DUF882 family)